MVSNTRAKKREEGEPISSSGDEILSGDEEYEKGDGEAQEQDSRRYSTASYTTAELQRQAVSIRALEAPKLLAFERKAITEFLEEKRLYENHCMQYGAVPVSILDMISLPVRRSICRIELDGVSEDNVTSDDLENVIANFLVTSKDNGKSREEAFGEIQMSFEYDDPTTRVHKYSEAIDDMLRENGWYNDYFGETSGAGSRKKLVKFLMNGIRPVSVKEAVKRRMDLLKSPLNVSLTAFWKTLKECCISQDEFCNKKKSYSSKPEGSNPNKRQRRGNKDQDGGKAKRTKSGTADNSKEKSERKRTVKCFGCEGAHYLSACKKLNESEKKDILKKKKAEWKTKRAENTSKDKDKQ